MSRPSRRLRGDSWVLAVAALCSLLSLSVAAALVLAPAHAPAPVVPRAAPAAPVADAALDRLRQEAASLDAESSRLLTAALLARYEARGDTDDLYEALQWIERDWFRPAWLQSTLVSQFVERHCDQKVVRWSWLCSGGD